MCALELVIEPQEYDFPVPVCFATSSGGITLDRDREGGNPFATALIGLCTTTEVPIADFPEQLNELTSALSNGRQLTEWVGELPSVDWRISVPKVRKDEHRVALVLVVSDYGGAFDLPGAAYDELRVASMLARNGFNVIQGVCPRRASLLKSVIDFQEASREADLAIIYSTGHGREARNAVYLLPSDYPMETGFRTEQLAENAVNVSMLASACRARSLNLVFFAGCRSRS